MRVLLQGLLVCLVHPPFVYACVRSPQQSDYYSSSGSRVRIHSYCINNLIMLVYCIAKVIQKLLALYPDTKRPLKVDILAMGTPAEAKLFNLCKLLQYPYPMFEFAVTSLFFTEILEWF